MQSHSREATVRPRRRGEAASIIYIQTNTNTDRHLHIQWQTHTDTHIDTNIHRLTHTQKYTDTHTQTHKQRPICTDTHMHRHTCTHMHTHRHTHTQTHKYTHINTNNIHFFILWKWINRICHSSYGQHTGTGRCLRYVTPNWCQTAAALRKLRWCSSTTSDLTSALRCNLSSLETAMCNYHFQVNFVLISTNIKVLARLCMYVYSEYTLNLLDQIELPWAQSCFMFLGMSGSISICDRSLH